jgi:hypothetical protein
MAQMAFAEHHDMIEALPADRADQPFCVGGRFARVNAETLGGLECRSIERGSLSLCTVAIPDKIARDLLPAASELIGNPFGRWMRSNSHPQQLPPAMVHNQQAIEQPERDCRHHEQVYRGNPTAWL